MSNKNLSTVATDVIAAYGITATNIINTTRFGGERVFGYVDQRTSKVLKRGTAALNKSIRSDLANGRERVGNVGVKALHLGTDGAQIVVGVAVDLAKKGVHIVASGAERLDRATNLNALTVLNRVALPAAIVVSQVADRIEAGSSELVRRVSGTQMPAKAVATRKLNAATRQAAATRKKVSKQVGKRVSKTADQVNATANRVSKTANRVTKTATKRVSKAVANTATQTSNAARRVARKANATAKAA